MANKGKESFSREETLRRKIMAVLKEQGFKINPHVRPTGEAKRTLKRIQAKARIEQIAQHKKFLLDHLELARSYSRSGWDVSPEEIELELREVKADSFEEKIFRWWNFVWWSIPYQRPYGRQMRFLLWDSTHNAPFGLICLHSPILKMSVRDKSLGIPPKELDIWVNRSMAAQRVGALPPYNQLLGGKLVALTLTANEVRDTYKRKYRKRVSMIKGRRLSDELLFITTTSAFGRSSLYNRLNFDGEIVAERLGYTMGSGSFHIPETLYQELLECLNSKGVDTSRGYGHGPSRKLKLLSVAFRHLNLPDFEFHGIKREFYLFSLATNLREVIARKMKPQLVNRPFDELVEYWKKRWALPRASRVPEWKEFNNHRFFQKIRKMLEGL